MATYNDLKIKYGQQVQKLITDVQIMDAIIGTHQATLDSIPYYPRTPERATAVRKIEAKLRELKLERGYLLTGDKPGSDFNIGLPV